MGATQINRYSPWGYVILDVYITPNPQVLQQSALSEPSVRETHPSSQENTNKQFDMEFTKVLFCCFLGLLCLSRMTEGKTFSRCGLANELLKHGISRSDLPNWVCLVESESSRNTAKTGGPNKNGSFDHGLFQINDKYWCKKGTKGNDCNVSCEDLKSDNIAAAVACAKKVYKRHGFSAWYGWRNKCDKKTLPNLNTCF